MVSSAFDLPRIPEEFWSRDQVTSALERDVATRRGPVVVGQPGRSRAVWL
ncbi:MAG: hypothetical protein ACRDSL_18105 [Pseudonocardiaceae bacterium]